MCEGVTIDDEFFIRHRVMFTNDKFPRATTADGMPQGPADWKVAPTHVGRGASIGSNATILCGITIGAGAMVGAGAVVTRDIPPRAIVAGVPARSKGPTVHESTVNTLGANRLIHWVANTCSINIK